jgi:hypothetical protein
MRLKIACAAALAGVTVGTLALAGGAATPALAGTVTDTSGTVVISLRHAVLESLAKDGIVVLPGGGVASYAAGAENITLQVAGGNATYIGTTGALGLAGSLELTDGATGRSVTLDNLKFSYDTSAITGWAWSKSVALGDVAGAENGQASAGPPASQQFTASAVILTPSGAAYLDRSLRTSYFKSGVDLGSFVATYDIQTVS